MKKRRVSSASVPLDVLSSASDSDLERVRIEDLESVDSNDLNGSKLHSIDDLLPVRNFAELKGHQNHTTAVKDEADRLGLRGKEHKKFRDLRRKAVAKRTGVLSQLSRLQGQFEAGG